MVAPRVARIAHRALVSVSGSQATEFLNGVLASLVKPPSSGPFFSALLHPQARKHIRKSLPNYSNGRVLYDLLVYSQSLADGKPGYLIEYDSRQTESPLLTTLKRFILRSKVKIRDVSDEYDVWASWGSPKEQESQPRQWRLASSGIAEPVWPENQASPWQLDQSPLSLRDMRAPGMGFRSLVRRGDRPSECSDHDESPFDDYLEHRVRLGVAEGTIDIPPMQAFPMESNLDLMGGLDFRKGCYVGQELTVRTYHTGVVRKRIIPVAIEDSAGRTLHSGMDIKALQAPGQEGPRPRGSGKLLTHTNGFGLALLRLDQVSGHHDGRLNLQIQDGQGLPITSVVPFFPDWWPLEKTTRTS